MCANTTTNFPHSDDGFAGVQGGGEVKKSMGNSFYSLANTLDNAAVVFGHCAQ